MGHLPKLAAALVSLLRPHLGREIARLVAVCLRRVPTAMAKCLHAPRMAKLSRRDDLVRRVYGLRTAKEVPVLRRPLRGWLLLRAAAARRACLSRAQPALANRLTRATALHSAPGGPLCRRLQPHHRGCDPRRLLDSFPEPAPDCPPRARQSVLAAEYSLDFPL